MNANANEYLCTRPFEFLKYHDNKILHHFLRFFSSFMTHFRYPGTLNRKQIKKLSKNCLDVWSQILEKWL